MPEDVGELVAAAREGDQRAFEELVKATYADTYTLAYRLLGDEEDARDVVQESYLRAYRGLKRFRGDAQFSTWLYRITANCAATQLGKRGAHRHDELLDDDARSRRAARVRPRGPGRRRRPPRPAPRRPARAAAAAAGRSSCSVTSTTCPTKPSPPSSGSPSRPPRSGSTGPAASSASGCSRCVERRKPVQCDDIADMLAEAAEGSVVLDRRPPATSSAACGARPSWCSTASCCGRCTPCAPRCSSPAPGLLADILATLEEAGERHAIRSLLTGSRAAYLGGIAVATAAGAAGAILLGRSRRRAQDRGVADRTARPGGRTLLLSSAVPVPPRAVAQLAEHRSPKPAVGGSSPSCPAPPPLRVAPWQ